MEIVADEDTAVSSYVKPALTRDEEGHAIGGQRQSKTTDSLVGKDDFSRVPTNVPTNEKQPSTIDRKPAKQVKRGWIEYTQRETKQYGKRRYPRYREWLWDAEKQEWVKSNPVYREDLDIMNEDDYVKYAERRDKAKKLGYSLNN